MKQMMTTSAGVFLAISIISIVCGGFALAGKVNFENELNKRDPLTKEINKQLGWDDTVNKQTLENFQNGISIALVAAAGSGAIAMGLAVAGKDKAKVKE